MHASRTFNLNFKSMFVACNQFQQFLLGNDHWRIAGQLNSDEWYLDLPRFQGRKAYVLFGSYSVSALKNILVRSGSVCVTFMPPMTCMHQSCSFHALCMWLYQLSTDCQSCVRQNAYFKLCWPHSSSTGGSRCSRRSLGVYLLTILGWCLSHDPRLGFQGWRGACVKLEWLAILSLHWWAWSQGIKAVQGQKFTKIMPKSSLRRFKWMGLNLQVPGFQSSDVMLNLQCQQIQASFINWKKEFIRNSSIEKMDLIMQIT